MPMNEMRRNDDDRRTNAGILKSILKLISLNYFVIFKIKEFFTGFFFKPI